jgi:hypothetical protein
MCRSALSSELLPKSQRPTIMLRLLAMFGLVGLLLATGCTTHAGCRSVAMSVGVYAIGKPSADAAVHSFVLSREAPNGLPRAGWTPTGSGQFKSGRSTLTVSRLADSTYLVTEATAC